MIKIIAKVVKGIFGGILALLAAFIATFIWISASLPKGVQWNIVSYFQHYGAMAAPRVLVAVIFILGFYSGFRRG